MKRKDPIDWLLEEENPAVRYATMRDVLGLAESDPALREARAAIPSTGSAAVILSAQNADGYWNTPKRYMERYDGTFWNFLLLLSLEVDPRHPGVHRAAQYLLETAWKPDWNGFTNDGKGLLPPCYMADMLRSLMLCGFGENTRVRAGVDSLIQGMHFSDGDADVENPDDGCLGRHTCIRCVAPVMRLLMDVKAQPKVQQLLSDGQEFLLVHHLYRRSHDLKKALSPRMTRLSYPHFYYPDLLQMLDVLTRMGCRDERMADAIKALQKKRDADGLWHMERGFNERGKDDLFPVLTTLEPVGAPSKWVTLSALRVLKRIGLSEG